MSLDGNLNQVRDLIDVMPVGIVLADSRGSVIASNPVAEAFVADAVSLDVLDATGRAETSFSSDHLAGLTRLAAERTPPAGAHALRAEVLVGRANGEDLVLLVDANSVPGAAGRGMLTLTLTDLTELRRVELQRNRLLRELDERVAEMDAALASFPEAILIYDTSGEVVRMNPAAEQLLGTRLEERRLRLEEYFPLLRAETSTGEPLAMEDTPFARARRGETVRASVMVLHPPGGRTVWMSARAAPIRFPDGTPTGRIVVGLTDVTPIHEMEEERENFIRMISHDLRNPLSPVIGYATMLQRVLAEKGMAREARFAERIRKGGERLNNMIDQLREAARFGPGRMELNKEPTDVGRMLREICEAVVPPGDRDRVTVALDGEVPAVALDRERIGRAVANYITNALKYSGAGSPVRVEAKVQDGELVVAVSDRGIGIPGDELPFVFEQNYRARTGKRSADGLGLGLYIARLGVEAHGGRVWVESEERRGSTFGFALPVSEKEGSLPVRG